MENSPIRDVADTAYWVAHWRAVESARPDALFHDPLAAKLAGERGRQIAEQMPSWPITAWNVALRTCIIDALILEAVRGGVDTVLNLGAGLDTRPYRLVLPPELRWIEVDQPQVMADKSQKLAGETPVCNLERVPLDLSVAEARRALLDRVDAGGKRVLVLTEGVVPYLTEEAVAELARDLRARPHVSAWVVDYFSREALAYRRRAPITAKTANAPFQFDPADWRAFFAAAGWRVGELRYLPDEAEKRNRPFPAPARMRLVMRLLRIFRARKALAGFRSSFGYARLEPQ